MSAPRHPEDGPGDAKVDRAFREIVAGPRASEGPRRLRPDDPRRRGANDAAVAVAAPSMTGGAAGR